MYISYRSIRLIRAITCGKLFSSSNGFIDQLFTTASFFIWFCHFDASALTDQPVAVPQRIGQFDRVDLITFFLTFAEVVKQLQVA